MAINPGLKMEIATIGQDITQPVFGGVLRHQDDTLLTRGGGLGLKIYDQIERDTHAFAVLQKRKMAIIAREWDIRPASTSRLDKKAADLVKAQLASLAMHVPDDEILPQASGFDAVSLDLLDAILKGFAVGEILWSTDGNEIVASEVRAKDQRRFTFSPGVSGYRLNLKTWSNLLPGEPVPPRKFIVHSFGAKDGSPYGLGLGTRLFWPVFFKRQGITFWLAFIDKFASPTVVGKYPSGTEPAEKAVLLAALQALRSESGVTIPEGMVIELLEAARSSSIDSYEKLARYMDEQISECVLGETGSTNQHGSGGSRARDQVGNEVRLELCKGDGDLLSATLNSTLVKWITQLNLPGANPPSVWREYQEPADLEKIANRDGVLTSQCGVKFSQSYFERTYGLETGDIDSVVQSAPLPAPTKSADGKFPKNEALAYADAVTVDAADLLADTLGKEGMQATAPWFAELKQLTNEAPSLETLRDGIIDLYPAMHPADLGAAIARATTLAQVSGRTAVKDGN